MGNKKTLSLPPGLVESSQPDQTLKSYDSAFRIESLVKSEDFREKKKSFGAKFTGLSIILTFIMSTVNPYLYPIFGFFSPGNNVAGFSYRGTIKFENPAYGPKNLLTRSTHPTCEMHYCQAAPLRGDNGASFETDADIVLRITNYK